MFDCWRRFVKFVSGFLRPSMTKKESKKLERFRLRQPTEFAIQPTTKSQQTGLDRSRHSMWYAKFAINVRLTVEMVEVSSTS